jgi:hypothetical protein
VVTLTLTVQVPPAAIVAPLRLIDPLPATGLKVGVPQPEVVAPGVAATFIAEGEVGNVSEKATPDSAVLLFGFSSVKVSAVVPPCEIGLVANLLVINGGAIPVIVAVPKPVAPEFVPPSVDVMNPLSLVFGPADVTVTVAVIVQLPLIGIVPPLKLSISGAVLVKVPPHWVELPEVTVTPAGSVSVKATLFNAVELFGLVNVKVRVEVPFTATVAGEKLFASVGGLGGRHPLNLTLSI